MPHKDPTTRANYHKGYYEKHKDYFVSYSKTRWKKNKKTLKSKYVESWHKIQDKFFEMYGNKCACCGESQREFLTIEHIHGQKGLNKESSYQAYTRAIREYREDIYQILCMNCNHAKGIYGYCPHNKD